MSAKSPVLPEKLSQKFGTFGGVFTPSLLTILGVIMFLRFTNVVGYAGLWDTLLILIAAKTISTITGLSIASIATNMRVKGGGPYYLISRSLGVEFGGVIAVFFFIAQAVAVTLYVVGFTEAVFVAFPDIPLSFRKVASLTNIVIFLCVYVGAGWTIRLQYGILAVLMLSLLSFFVQAGREFSWETLHANLAPDFTPEYTLTSVFALFFPAVTGIMAGVNMSGDLKDPSRSIPRGTFCGIGSAALIYLLIAFLLAASIPHSELRGDSFVMKDHSFSPALIYAGVFCATLSSALGSMMGAPRILQAFSRDNVFPWLRWFGAGSGRLSEPRNATIVTFLIAQIGVMAGDLNTIAPIITMFFLLTYGTVNLACFYEGWSNNPSFRPTFRLNHWTISILGAMGCLAVMFLINTLWATVAILLAAALYHFISRADIQVKWGDVNSGLAYQRARKALLQLERERYHPKNWRPSILVLSGGAYNRLHLCEYANWFVADQGVISIGQIIRGKLEDLIERRAEAEALLRKFILKEELPAFPVVAVEEDVRSAIKAILQCHGIGGGMRPNTVLMGWSKDADNTGIFAETLNFVKRMKRSMIVVACEQEEEKTQVPEGAINIWWTSAQNGPMMLLLAHMLTRNDAWHARAVRIIRTVVPKADLANVEAEMREIVSQSRIDADVLIIPTEDPLASVREQMQPSALLLAGFAPQDEVPNLPYLQTVVNLPGDVILVYNAGDISLQA